MIGVILHMLASTAPIPAATCIEAEKHALDFWIGKWDVVHTQSGTPIASSEVTSVADGCAIQEIYSQTVGPGGKPMRYEGRSYSAYNGADKLWHQFYVDNAGAAFSYAGRASDGAMILTAKAGQLATRMAVRSEGKTVRQIGEISRDGGISWSTNFDFTYRPQ